MSTNGMIADKEGREEFLSDNIWNLFVSHVKSTKSVVMGRKAYEGLLSWPKEYIAELSGITKIVLTSSDVALVDDWMSAKTPQQAIEILKNSNINDVTIAGGASTSSSFLKENIMDEIVFAIEPVVKAEGIPAFAPTNIETELELVSTDNIKGILLLRYKRK
jgi:dihydrofolate reductase